MKVVCIWTLLPEKTGYHFILGKTYDIKKMINGYFIRDEDDYLWYFDTRLKENFITLQEYRKLKLEKLKSI